MYASGQTCPASAAAGCAAMPEFTACRSIRVLRVGHSGIFFIGTVSKASKGGTLSSFPIGRRTVFPLRLALASLMPLPRCAKTIWRQVRHGSPWFDFCSIAVASTFAKTSKRLVVSQLGHLRIGPAFPCGPTTSAPPTPTPASIPPPHRPTARQPTLAFLLFPCFTSRFTDSEFDYASDSNHPAVPTKPLAMPSSAPVAPAALQRSVLAAQRPGPSRRPSCRAQLRVGGVSAHDARHGTHRLCITSFPQTFGEQA